MEAMGWGRYPKTTADLIEPADLQSLQKFIVSKPKSTACIARGSGRSYGDSALAGQLISSRFLDSFLEIDEERRTLRCGAGARLGEILRVCIPRGLFLPVLPGTQEVSVGGAIAADIHGKNHHRDGTFCEHILQLSLVLASGELVSCSASENSELFRATCGGMGLTGVVVDATLALTAIESSYIEQRSLVASNLSACFELIEEKADTMYSVAWLDCLAGGDNLGRSEQVVAVSQPEDLRPAVLQHLQRQQLGDKRLARTDGGDDADAATLLPPVRRDVYVYDATLVWAWCSGHRLVA